MLSPQSPGSARVVGSSPEPVTPSVVQPSTGMNAAMGQPIGPVNAPAGMNAGGQDGQNNLPVIGPVSNMGSQGVPQQGAPVNAASGAQTPSVLGARAPIQMSSQLGGSWMGNKTATPTEMMNVSAPAGRTEYPSEQAFQEAQTPIQNALGGIGKYGTAITSKLFGPTNTNTQLVPGGAFKKLQDLMSPIMQKLIPNFNKNIA